MQPKPILLRLLLAVAASLPSFCLPAQIVPAPTDKQLIALDKAAAPFRKQVTDILEADKTGQYQRYKSDVKALAEESDPDQKAALAEKLRQNHYTFIKTAFTAAKVDLDALKRQYAQILGHSKFTMDEFGGISSITEAPKAGGPPSNDGELDCPFNVKDEFVNAAGLASCKSDVNSCNFTLTADAYTLAAGCRSKGSLGDKVELPAGNFSKATIHAQYNFNYFGLALSLVGYGQFNAKVGVRLTGNNVDKVIILHDAWVVAPLVFYNEMTKSVSDFQAIHTFTGSFNTTLTPMAYAETFAIAAGINSTGGFLHVNPVDFIKLDAGN